MVYLVDRLAQRVVVSSEHLQLEHLVAVVSLEHLQPINLQHKEVFLELLLLLVVGYLGTLKLQRLEEVSSVE